MRTRTDTVATTSLCLLIATACSMPRLEGVTATSIDNRVAVNFFVSTKGKDTWSGKLANPGENDGPFATVARARKAVRDGWWKSPCSISAHLGHSVLQRDEIV
jgi:hypothetical protein